MLDWHRLFGTMMLDRCFRTSVEVSLELDLSLAQQFLDCALLRKSLQDPEPELPDGFSPLAEHNLISFKSFRESLTLFAIEELIGHAIAYRKLNRTDKNEPLPRHQLRLLLVCTRFPEALAQSLEFTPVSDGVYNVVYGMTPLRLIVIHELPLLACNAPLLFFSASPRVVQFARNTFVPRSPELSTGLLNEVLNSYLLEGIQMPFTAEDFMREHARNVIERSTPEERLRGLPPEERLRGLAAEERLRGLPSEERVKGLAPEERLRGLPAEERLRGLPSEERVKGLAPEEVFRSLTPEARAQLEALILANARGRTG